MSKIANVKRAFDCDLCDEILIDPVTLQCGNSVCKIHLQKFKKNFHCKLCTNRHRIPKGGFATNKRMKIGLDIELNTLRAEPIYEECKRKLQEVKQSVSKLELIQTYPEEYLFEYFENIKCEIEFRASTLKESIDDCSNELIHSVEEIKANSIKRSKQMDQKTSKTRVELLELVTQNLENHSELETITKNFNTFKINETNFEAIKIRADALKINFDNMLVKYKESLLENKTYQFGHDDTKVSEIFGSIEVLKQVNILC